MSGPYGLGGFAGQLTADELANAYASAGGRPDELDFGELPSRQAAPPSSAYTQPSPAPVVTPPPAAADMHIAPSRRAGVGEYDQQLLDNQNQRIDLAGQGGAEASAMYDKRAGLRGEQAASARAGGDQAKARVEEDRARELRHRDEADRLYEQLKAGAQPPKRKAVEQVMGIIGSVLAMGGGKSGMAQGAAMMGSLLGGDHERWAQEQEANSNLYRAALQGVHADQESQSHQVGLAGNIAALDAHYYDAALEQAKEQGLSAEARRVATGLQLDLREKGIQALRATRVAEMKAAAGARKNTAEDYFWRVPLDQLREMPSQVLGEQGQKVLAERTKQDQGYRENEADIRKKSAATGEGPGQEILPGVVATVPLEKKDVSDIRANAQALERIKGNYRKLAEIRERHAGRPFAAWTDRDDVREAGNIISEMTGTLNQFAGRGAPSNAELEDMKKQLLDPTDTYTLTDPRKVYEAQIKRLESNFEAGLRAVGAERVGGRVQMGQSGAGGDPRVRPGHVTPAAAARGVAPGRLPAGPSLQDVAAAQQRQEQDDAARDAEQAQLAQWVRR